MVNVEGEIELVTGRERESVGGWGCEALGEARRWGVGGGGLVGERFAV